MPNFKSYFATSIVVLLTSGLNFILFIEGYKGLAFPYLHEEQRVYNAPYIFMYVLPAFILVAIISLGLYKLVNRRVK